MSRSTAYSRPQQTLRRIVPLRTATRFIDPTDPVATAGYVHLRGASPDTESGLPFANG